MELYRLLVYIRLSILPNDRFMTRWILSLVFLIAATSMYAQDEAVAESKDENVWKTLSKITYKKEYDEFLGFKIDKPVFAEDVKNLEDQVITIRGYIIPVEGYKSHSEFIFSAYPYNMCFFCGGAGPETVMEVEASEDVEYTAEQITLQGKLQLNADDVNRLMYVLVDATLVQG